jgi:CheY-like chemotaxis protein
MDLGEKNFAPQEPALIDKINSTLENLGSTAKWKRAPEKIEGAEILKDKKIAMVDDEQGVLEAFVPDLMTATDGNASFIRYQGQSIEELVAQIQTTEANLVLLDYHLSKMLKGSDVARALLDGGFSGTTMGFSSDRGAKEDFEKAGALSSVEKEAWSPEVSVKQLAKLLTEK